MQVHAFSVCDSPDYFYDYVQGLIDGLQAGLSSRDLVDIRDVSDLYEHMNRLPYFRSSFQHRDDCIPVPLGWCSS